MLALLGQLALAFLPTLLTASKTNPYLAGRPPCHAMAGVNDPSSPTADGSNHDRGHHDGHCPLCFALHQFWSYGTQFVPTLPPPPEGDALKDDAILSFVGELAPWGLKQPRAPPFSV